MAKFRENYGFRPTDGSENVAFEFEAVEDYATSEGKLAAWYDGDGVEEASILHDGSWQGPVLDRGGAVYNVKHPDFGAKGDGSTDDTAAVQAAADASESAKGTLYIPHGTYRVSDKIEFTSRCRVVGAGWGAVFKLDAAMTDFLFLAQNTTTDLDYAEFRNFQVDGNGAGPANSGIIAISNVPGFLVDHVWIHDAGDPTTGSTNGITCTSNGLANTAPEGTIRDCLLEACSKAAINWTGGANNGLISGNIVRNGKNGAPGIDMDSGWRGKVIGNSIYNNEGHGINVNVTASARIPKETIILGNSVYGNGTVDGVGVQVSTGGNSPDAVMIARVLIAHNTITDNGDGSSAKQFGVFVSKSSAVKIEHNLIYGNSNDGISINGSNDTIRWISVLGNHIGNNNQRAASSGSGLQLLDIADSLIKDNIFFDDQDTPTQEYGIHYAEALDNIREEGNLFEGLGTADRLETVEPTNSIVGGLGRESANAEEPTAANWELGDIVDFTDSGDGSGDGQYLLLSDGSTWAQLA